MEEEKKETTQTAETTTTNTAEKKEKGFKKYLPLVIVCVLLVVALGVGLWFLLGNKADTPEKIAEKYVNAMSEGNADKLMDIMDIKGAYAWKQCNGNTDKFVEEYNKVNDSDVNSYKDEIKKSLDSAMGMLKAFGGVSIKLKNVETPEELTKGLYKVTANMEMEAFGQKQDQGTSLIVYNGKYIGEAK